MMPVSHNSRAKRHDLAWHWLGKDVSSATDMHITTEELLEMKFSICSMPELYGEDKQD
jgi:hypothetical protein